MSNAIYATGSTVVRSSGVGPGRASLRKAAEAQVRNLNHSLWVMTGRYLSDFLVPEGRRLPANGQASVQDVQLEPLEDRGIVVLATRSHVSDRKLGRCRLSTVSTRASVQTA